MDEGTDYGCQRMGEVYAQESKLRFHLDTHRKRIVQVVLVEAQNGKDDVHLLCGDGHSKLHQI